jgi:hypothetical protein
MAVSFQLPTDLEKQLREEFSDLNQVAKEAALVELYRRGMLSHHQLATALGLGRLELDGVLKEHGVTEDSITIEEFDEQAASLRRLIDK